MDGIAAGLCAKMDLLNPTTQGSKPDLPASPACNVTEWSTTIKLLNMLPELIRMTCTAYGNYFIILLAKNMRSWNWLLDFVPLFFCFYLILIVFRCLGKSYCLGCLSRRTVAVQSAGLRRRSVRQLLSAAGPPH